MTSDREKWLSIGVVKGTAPARMEKRWDKDMPAYKHLRENGLQPKSIDGCAELESRATDKIEVQMGHLWRSKEERKEALEGIRRAEDIGMGLA